MVEVIFETESWKIHYYMMKRRHGIPTRDGCMWMDAYKTDYEPRNA